MNTVPLGPRRFGSFEIIGPLGAGAMGEIYRARDTRLGREVALKVLPGGLASDPEHLRRFEREARSASALSHPNILTVFDFGWEQDVPYMVTELLVGETLRERLDRAPLRPAEALGIALQIADGLAAAHVSGVLHRDLKPENLFLTRDGRVKILDFGLACWIAGGKGSEGGARLTEPGRLLGTLSYMSPEQARGETLDERSDVFSLGAVLYEMLARRAAFPGTGPGVLHSILYREPEALARVAPDVPRPLDDLVRRALEKDPDDRYQSARDFAADLRRARKRLEGPRLPVRWPRVPRGLRVALALAGTLGVAALLLAALRPREAPPLHTAQIRPLTPYLGNIDAPLVSDGKRVLYTVDRSGGSTVYQIGLDGGEPTPLPLPFKGARVFDASPDGMELLIGVADESTSPWTLPLWSVPAIGGAPRRLGNCACQGAVYSPDGKTIACAAGGELWLSGRDGASPRLLWKSADAMLFFPAWSPDASRIRVTVRPRTWRSILWEVDVASGRAARLLDPAYASPGEQGGTWSPDGRWFTYTGRIGTLFALFARDESRPARAPVALTTGPLDMYGPAVTKDPGVLVALGEELQGELVAWNRTAGAFQPCLDGPSAHSAAWSHDRSRVAWAGYPDGTLWLARADGSERHKLATPGLRTFEIAWSADDRTLIFVGSNTDYVNHIYTIAVDNGLPKRITSLEQSEFAPCLLADGRVLFMATTGTAAEKRQRLLTWRPGDGAIEPFPGGDGLRMPIVTPDGARIAALDAKDRPQVYDATRRQWRPIGEVSISWWTWDHEASGFLVDTRVEGVRGLYAMTAAGRLEERIVDLTEERRIGTYEERWFDLTPAGEPMIMRTVGGTRVYRVDLDTSRP